MQEVFAKSIDEISNGVSIADPSQPDIPLVYVNKAFEDITGYKSEEVLGRNCRFLQGDERNQRELVGLRKAIRDKKPYTAILRNYTKNGALFYNEFHISHVKVNGKGYYIGIQNDVTRRVKAEKELEKYRQKLETTISRRTQDLVEANKKLLLEIEERKKAQENILKLNEKLRRFAYKTEQRLSKENRVLLRNSEKELLYKIVSGHDKKSTSTLYAAKKRFEKIYLNTRYIPSLKLFNHLTIVVSKKGFPGATYSMKGEKCVQIFLEPITFDAQQWHFDLRKSKVKWFDHAGYLERKFGFEHKPRKESTAMIPMNENLYRTLFGLVSFPEAKLDYLSTRLDLSKPTISKNAKLLKNKGLVHKRSLLEPKSLGGKYFVLKKGKDDNSFFEIQGNITLSFCIYDEEDVERLEENDVIMPIGDEEYCFEQAVKTFLMDNDN